MVNTSGSDSENLGSTPSSPAIKLLPLDEAAIMKHRSDGTVYQMIGMVDGKLHYNYFVRHGGYWTTGSVFLQEYDQERSKQYEPMSKLEAMILYGAT